MTATPATASRSAGPSTGRDSTLTVRASYGWTVADLEIAAWALAAVVATQNEIAAGQQVLGADPERAAVLAALGLAYSTDDGLVAAAELGAAGQGAGAASARLTSLRQALAAAEGQSAGGWAEQPDEVLLGQGRSSAALGQALAERVVPSLPGLSARLGVPGSRVLDVGTGVGLLALAIARGLPAVQVLGIDVLDRALRLAEAELARSSDEARRVRLRYQDVAEVTEHSAFDLVWLPAPFLPESTIDVALPRLFEALTPGGWIIAGTNGTSSDPLAAAVARWQAARNGGSAIDEATMRSLLSEVGFDDVSSRPTIPGGPVLVLGRRATGERR